MSFSGVYFFLKESHMDNISSPSTGSFNGSSNGSSNGSTPSGAMSTNGATPVHTDNVVTRGVDSVGAALHSGIDKVVDPARDAVASLSSAAHSTVDNLASSANSTVDRLSERTRRITEAPSRAVESSKSWVQGKPLEAVGAALVVGFIVGRLTSR